MKAWEFDKIRSAVKGKWVMRGGRAFNGKLATDSRKVGEGELFVAIAGKTHDAHRFVDDVIGRGVAGVLVHREMSAETVALAKANDVAVLQVEDTIAAINRLAAAYRKELRAKVIAVGGSNGKTTTKRILDVLLAEKFTGHASPKSFNNNIGMPLTLLSTESQHDYVVLEIGTNAPGEIAALGEVCKPDIAVIVSVGLEHLELLGDLQGVANEEAAIGQFVEAGGTLIVPGDSAELATALKSFKGQRITVGGPGGRGSSGADLQATDIIQTRTGLAFGVNGRGSFDLPLLGEHNAVNALFAVAVGRRLGMNDEAIAAGLKKVKTPEMRMEPLNVGGHFVINDAYNANPTSMAAAIKTFAVLPGITGRRVAILGDMLELGEGSETLHRGIGTAAGGSGIGLLVAVGPWMKFAAEEAAKKLTVHWFATTAEAAGGITRVIKPEDAILLKGSRGMQMEKVLEALAKYRDMMAATPGVFAAR